jgi:hypothetical protein
LKLLGVSPGKARRSGEEKARKSEVSVFSAITFTDMFQILAAMWIRFVSLSGVASTAGF